MLELMRRTVIPPLWALFRRIPGGIKFWQWCTITLRITLDSRVPSAKQVAIAQTPDFYGSDYFDKRKNVMEESGYDVYEPGALEPEVAKAVKRIFKPRRVLDVGCAKGFTVDAMRQVNLDAWGVDLSEYAINHAIPSACDYVDVGNVLDLDFPDNAFDLILCFETLEHLESNKADQAINQLHRVTSDKVWVTIPCLGINDYGPPHGWPQGKLKESFWPMYEADVGFPDPTLVEHLMVDRHGFPLQGHITTASFRWWTEHFLQQGFIRRGDFERMVNNDVEAANTGWLNCMVFEKVRPVSASLSAPPQSVLLKSANDTETPLVWQPDQVGDAQSDLIHLEPGIYATTIRTSIAQVPPNAPGWLKALVFTVHSENGAQMHGLRTILLSAFERSDVTEGESHLTVTMPFGCNAATEVTFRATCPAQFLVKVDPCITIEPAGSD